MRFSSTGESDAASTSMVPRNSASRSRYPSDLTDPEWELIKPLIPPAKRGGGQRTVNLREKPQPQCARISPPRFDPPYAQKALQSFILSRSLCVEVLGNNQNCLANSTACLFPASIMSTARPSQLCSTVRVTTLRTPMNRSQNST
jgi:hypothetical protein